MTRHADHPVDPIFLRRWSARAMSGAAVGRETVLTLLEAARWSPSAGNGQPWRFVYAVRDGDGFGALLDALDPGNREWCRRAGALLLLFAQTVRTDGRPAGSARFDCGAACLSIALQAALLGLVAHPMGGFDRGAIAAAVGIEAGMEPQVVIAIGFPGSKEELSDRDRAREEPSGRHPVTVWAREGRWG